ncbi:hypothetical protein MRB53_016772 [Persea americana]|uniref:Uncharacterized protein n=1 Tax=Persea americana TaxID=3435 RepID=A0ACC2M3P1_PERAE|nr:hypothetical protein MRB53_016772 [Persea americana]
MVSTEDFSYSDYDYEGEHPLLGKENENNEVKDEKPKPASIKANATKPKSFDAKPKEKIVEAKKPNDDSDDKESDGEDSDDDEVCNTEMYYLKIDAFII